MSDTPRNDLATAAAAAFVKPFGGLIRLEPEGAPALWVDGRASPPEIGAGPPESADEAAVCIWRASRDTLLRIFEGERLLASAYVSGRLSIVGDMSIMARLHLERGPRG